MGRQNPSARGGRLVRSLSRRRVYKTVRPQGDPPAHFLGGGAADHESRVRARHRAVRMSGGQRAGNKASEVGGPRNPGPVQVDAPTAWQRPPTLTAFQVWSVTLTSNATVTPATSNPKEALKPHRVVGTGASASLFQVTCGFRVLLSSLST